MELTVQPTHCVFWVEERSDERLSGSGLSCMPSGLGRQLQHPLRLSFGAFQAAAVLRLADGLEDTFKLLIAEKVVDVVISCNAIKCVASFCTGPQLKHGTSWR